MKQKLIILVALVFILFVVMSSGTVDLQTSPSQTDKTSEQQDRVQIKEASAVPADLSPIVLRTLDAYVEDGTKENLSGTNMKASLCKGEQTGTLADYEIYQYTADLNADGVDEFIIEPWSVCHATGFFRGASGNGPFMVYTKSSGAWQEAGVVFGNGVRPTDAIHNGYHDLETFLHTSVATGTLTIYQWDMATSMYAEFSHQDVSESAE